MWSMPRKYCDWNQNGFALFTTNINYSIDKCLHFRVHASFKYLNKNIYIWFNVLCMYLVWKWWKMYKGII